MHPSSIPHPMRYRHARPADLPLCLWPVAALPGSGCVHDLDADRPEPAGRRAVLVLDRLLLPAHRAVDLLLPVQGTGLRRRRVGLAGRGAAAPAVAGGIAAPGGPVADG